ncbi:hypothetical protein FRC15_005779 [Serendipita sp. 397]|nr:hypothetical protein FRC15_005779 [Serendipita sp. 397]
MPSPTTTNYTSSPTTLSPSLHQPPFLGISFGFGRPVLDARPLLTPAPIPNNVIVDSSPSRPFYIAAHSWYDLLGFLSQQRHTYLDASARVRSLIYSTYSEGWTEVPGRKTPVNGLTPQLRVVLQFVKLGNGRKRVVLYLATDNPTPIPSDYPDSDTSVIPYLFPAPDAIKPLEDTSDGRIFSVVTQPFRRLPLLMPHLSSYLQASLDESRVATDSRRRLYQLVERMTVPSRRTGSSLDFASSLFKRGHRNYGSVGSNDTERPQDSPSSSKLNFMLKRFRRKSTGPRSSLDDPFLIVTPQDLMDNA